MITQKFNIYLHAGIAFAPVVHTSQYSQGETWTFTILDNDGSVYRPSSGALIGVKADGRAIAGITGTVNADGSVSIVTTQQLTAAAGRGLFELTIDGGTNGTANFIIEVEKKPTDDAILSESDLSIIQQGMNSVTPQVIQETVSDYLEEHMTNPPIDPTLTISNAAADAKVTGDKIADLKNASDDIRTAYGVNLFDVSSVNRTSYGITNIDGVLSGKASDFSRAFSGDNYIPIAGEPNQQYSCAFEAYTEGNQGTTGNGLTLYFVFSDGTANLGAYTNNGMNEYTRVTGYSDANKTVVGIRFSYGSNSENNWKIKNLIIAKGTVAPDFVPYFTAYDKTARNDINDIENKISVLPELIRNVSYTATRQGTSMVFYPLYAGETYEITPTGGITFTTRNEANQVLQEMPLYSQTKNYFTCTADAVKFSFYSVAGVTVEVKSMNTTSYIASENKEAIFKLTDGVPSYFHPQIENAVSTIRELMNDAGKKGDAFVFITDLHWSTNTKNSPYLVKYIFDHSNVPFIICGGDLITQGEREPMIESMTDLVKSFDFKNHFFPVAFGNHDDNWNNYNNQHDYPARYFDINTEYALMGKQNDNHVTWLTDTDLSFYFDNETTKTRYIVLDTGDDGNTGTNNRVFSAISELAECMLNVTDGWKIVIVGHIVTYGRFISIVEPMMDAYNARSVYDTYDFVNAKGIVVMGIGGHTHEDSDHVTAGGIPVIVTSCDTITSGATSGTVTEQCFDVIVMNYTNRTINCVRIGRGNSREFTY